MKIPDYKLLVFNKNNNRPDIYDLLDSNFKKFKYFRFSKPRNNKFNKQGAKYIIESWDNGIKTLFSGLIPVIDNYYYGDQKDTKTGKKSTIIAKINPTKILIYYFNSFSLYPKYRKQFVNNFIESVK